MVHVGQPSRRGNCQRRQKDEKDKRSRFLRRDTSKKPGKFCFYKIFLYLLEIRALLIFRNICIHLLEVYLASRHAKSPRSFLRVAIARHLPWNGTHDSSLFLDRSFLSTTCSNTHVNVTKVKKKSFSRPSSRLPGWRRWLHFGLFGSDQMLPFIRWEDCLHHQRELRQLRDSTPHPRGPCKCGFRHLSETKAKAAKDAADAETSSIVRKIRSGLRSILGDGTIPFSFVDTKRRASNCTTLESGCAHAALFNSFANETEVRCRLAPVVGPEQIEAVTSSRNFTNTIVVGCPGPDTSASSSCDRWRPWRASVAEMNGIFSILE